MTLHIRPALHRAMVFGLAMALAMPVGIPLRAQELPALGDAGAEDLSPADERRLGERIMQEVRRDPDFLTDPEAIDYVQNLGYQLVSASAARFGDFTFFVVRDPSLNAFALPGGFVGLHSGLIIAAQSESELASVVAHEIGHVQQRHIARMISKQRDGGLIAIGSLLLALLAARAGSASAGPAVEAALAVGQATAIQNQLNFSRDAEREADRVGFDMLVNANFDARGMAQFFGRLQQGTRIYESAAPEYLRSHPLTGERIADIQNRLRDSRIRQRADPGDFHLIRARLRVLQDLSVSALQDDQQFFATQLRNRSYASEAAANYGLAYASLKLNQPREAYAAAQAARKAVKAPTAMLDKLVAESRFAAARNDEERDQAIVQARENVGRYPISRLTAMHYVDVLQKTRQDEAAVGFMREQVAITRSDPAYFNLLATSYGALNKRTLQHQAIGEAYVLMGAVPAAAEQFQLARKAADADFYVLSEVDARLRQITAQIREQKKEDQQRGRPPEDRTRPPTPG